MHKYEACWIRYNIWKSTASLWVRTLHNGKTFKYLVCIQINDPDIIRQWEIPFVAEETGRHSNEEWGGGQQQLLSQNEDCQQLITWTTDYSFMNHNCLQYMQIQKHSFMFQVLKKKKKSLVWYKDSTWKPWECKQKNTLCKIICNKSYRHLEWADDRSSEGKRRVYISYLFSRCHTGRQERYDWKHVLQRI